MHKATVALLAFSLVGASAFSAAAATAASATTAATNGAPPPAASPNWSPAVVEGQVEEALARISYNTVRDEYEQCRKADNALPVQDVTIANTCVDLVEQVGEVAKSARQFCPTPRVTPELATAEVSSYVKGHPAQMDDLFTSVVFQVLKQKWPCRG